MRDTPPSPSSSAIHYWGGDWSQNDGQEIVDGCLDDSFEDNRRAKLRILQRRCDRYRSDSVVKFELSLEDEEDEEHWMFARASSLSLSSVHIQSALSAARNNDLNGGSTENKDDDDFDAIPIIDLSMPKSVCARQIGDACRDVGFFYIVNHGVEPCVMEEVLEGARKFFQLDLESKLRASQRGDDGVEGTCYRGYFEIGGEDLENKDGTRDLAVEEGAGSDRDSTKKKRKGDFKEGFDCGLEGGVNDDGDACIEFFGKNMWPDEQNNPSIIGFRETLLKYQAELIGLSDVLLLALGKSLNNCAGVSEDYFVCRSRNPMCTLRLLHYPPVDRDDGLTNTLGCGAHTDYGLFTILQQDSTGGLQVRNRGGRWIDAKPLKGSFVINVGDMLSRWTNGEYASTVHRVVSRNGDRFSVPFFFNPDSDAVVRPLRNAEFNGREKSADDDASKKCLTALEILKDRYIGTFTKLHCNLNTA